MMTTISDTDLKELITSQKLINNGDEKQVYGACYELRFGTVYYDLTESEKPIHLTGEQSAIIKPGHRVVLITREDINVPNDMLVRVVSKGSLFSIGLTPVATYADPGFSGHLGIVTQNVSDKYIELPVNEPIAKAEFSRLSSPATSLYKGQHGFQTEIWPIKQRLRKTHEQVAKDERVGSEKEEAYKILPKATETILRELEEKQRYTDYYILALIAINSISLIALQSDYLTAIYSIGINLISSLIFLYLTRPSVKKVTK